jgi:hypothetical protein
VRKWIAGATATMMAAAVTAGLPETAAQAAPISSYRIAAARESAPVASDGETFLSTDFYVQKPIGAAISIAGSAERHRRLLGRRSAADDRVPRGRNDLLVHGRR